MQGRKGPSIVQPFYDVQKLFKKEVAVVNRAEKFFLIFYLIFMIFTGFIFFSGGDILLVTFAFTLTSIFLVVGAYSTNSPYSTIGAERELLQMMAYEPMILLTSIGFYLAKGTFNVFANVWANKVLPEPVGPNNNILLFCISISLVLAFLL